jgi:hypothetical protein
MSGVDTVMAVLEEHGYERRPRPLVVARTKFDFEAAAVGTKRSHDLIIVAGGAIAPSRLQRMVASVARGLDIGESKRPLTLVLVGPVATSAKVEMEEIARVLTVSADPTRAEVEGALAVLLPLKAVLGGGHRGLDPLDEVRAHLTKWNQDFDQFLLAARHGQVAVEKALSRYVNEGANPTYAGGGDDD